MRLDHLLSGTTESLQWLPARVVLEVDEVNKQGLTKLSAHTYRLL